MSECILWDKSISNTGYGHAWRNGKSVGAHRAAYEDANGTIPQGLFVLHRCDVKQCVNPDHLYLGTPKDNARDAIERGQIATGKRHGKNTKPESRLAGERNPNAKLSAEQVSELRTFFHLSDWTLAKTANYYNVSISTISRAVRGDSYKGINALNQETK
jgi:hypothetical protein